MAKRRKSRKKKKEEEKRGLHPDTKASILGISLLGLALILILSGFAVAGPVGEFIFMTLQALLGWGYWLAPIVFILISINAFTKNKNFLATPAIIGAIFFLVSGLGLLDLIKEGTGGLAGDIFWIFRNSIW